jgi:hypothetical protein
MVVGKAKEGIDLVMYNRTKEFRKVSRRSLRAYVLPSLYLDSRNRPSLRICCTDWVEGFSSWYHLTNARKLPQGRDLFPKWTLILEAIPISWMIHVRLSNILGLGGCSQEKMALRCE